MDIEKDRLEAVIKDLEEAFSIDAIYKEPGLTIHRVAQLIGHPPYVISIAINTIFHKKFNNYVNDYRIDEVISDLNDDSFGKYTIEGLARNVGFSSISCFYEAFRRKVRLTPLEYLKSKTKINNEYKTSINTRFLSSAD